MSKKIYAPLILIFFSCAHFACFVQNSGVVGVSAPPIDAKYRLVEVAKASVAQSRFLGLRTNPRNLAQEATERLILTHPLSSGQSFAFFSTNFYNANFIFGNKTTCQVTAWIVEPTDSLNKNLEKGVLSGIETPQKIDTSSALPSNVFLGNTIRNITQVDLKSAIVYIPRHVTIAQNSSVLIRIGQSQLKGKIKLKAADIENVLIVFKDNKNQIYTIQRNKKDIITY